MAKGPAVVVVARHGARLDAADKTWHLTSPTPYDPPLTYGGWSQGKALGLRIAALLHQRDVEQLEAPQPDGPRAEGSQRPRKKRKIVIHSSPYLRCVQTSTAVAAGISQYQPPSAPNPKLPSPSAEKTEAPGKTTATESPKANSYSLQPFTLQPLAYPKVDVSPRSHKGPEKILLRIDAFLGEWLSPDYYEDITPPPNSTLMVAGAKADLLRRGDYIQEMSNKTHHRGFFPGGWVGKGAATIAPHNGGKSPFPSRGSLASVSPFRERSSSQDSNSLQRTKSRENVASHPLAPIPQTGSRIYDPPVPAYSVSPADTIPRGYFAHAREACILVDFQWDSMRPPMEWGDGGEYGDEWSTMHKRFRRGLTGMMEWYREHGATPPKEQISGFMFKEPLRLTPHPATKRKTEPFPSFNGEPDVEDDEELVLILLTHGAGCNALLGAITNQPVLMDIGLASLSMAVRRDGPQKPMEHTVHTRRPSVADPVDHLRAGIDPSRLQSKSQVSSPAIQPNPPHDSRRRVTGSSSGASSPLDPPFSLGEPYRTWNSSMGNMRRTMSSGSNQLYTQSNLNPSTPSASTSSPTGLWSSPKLAPTKVAASSDGRASPGADMVLNFTNQQPKPTSDSTSTATNGVKDDIPALDGVSDVTNGLERLNTNEQREVSDSVAPLSKPTKSHNRNSSTKAPALWGAKAKATSNAGLWGPPRLDDVYEHRRGPQPKRRWTVTEREESM
ncbi:hypothetical protein CC86DRAFT_391564 [Ophiobolus disseminans]|uniref:Phosphoglycerate mutase-like protein n=1 Tax=Ophiobolus disseminans TaxID=1469910 RepID=A0A6A7ADB4_9PLEO|nr:hypothetical protein CC86DRAFT_391564 [Ophiobolus disseminans]